MKSILCYITLLLLLSLRSSSQNNYLGTWNVANIQYSFNKKTSIWAEGQLRSQKFINDFFYHEIKTGINYKPNKSIGILVGIGQYNTYSIGGNFKTPITAHEFRLWEQFTLVNNIGNLKLEHRYRIEQRWRNSEYRNRFRYRINPILPINKNKLQNKTLFATLYDEIFLSDKPGYFERNRFFAGFGYQFSKSITLQSGFIRQFDYSPSQSSTKDFFQTTLFIRLQHQNETTDLHPSSID